MAPSIAFRSGLWCPKEQKAHTMGSHTGNGHRCGLCRTGGLRHPAEQAEERVHPQETGGVPHRSRHVISVCLSLVRGMIVKMTIKNSRNASLTSVITGNNVKTVTATEGWLNLISFESMNKEFSSCFCKPSQAFKKLCIVAEMLKNVCTFFLRFP